MGVDSGYGSGKARSAANSASRRNSAASAGLRKKGIKRAGRKYTSTATAKAKSVSGSSDYVARENAARTQLGTAGVAARARQLPAAARAFTREMTGVDVSRKGVSVDPASLAMALPVGKVLKAAKALRATGRITAGAGASILEARVTSKLAGREAGKRIAEANMPKYSRPSVFDVRQSDETLSRRIMDAVKIGKENRITSQGIFERINGTKRRYR